MYHNYYRDNEPGDEVENKNRKDENPELEIFNEFDGMPEYEDASVVEDGFRAAEDFDLEDEFVEFTPPFTCPFFRQPNPNPNNPPFGGYQHGGNPPPRPPFGEPGRPPFPPQGGPNMNQGSMPPGAPPNYTPAKAQAHHGIQGGVSAYAVDQGALRPCRYKYVYLWLKNGESFWAYLTYIGRTSASGYRWTGHRWLYFGIDLRRIESFICR